MSSISNEFLPRLLARSPIDNLRFLAPAMRDTPTLSPADLVLVCVGENSEGAKAVAIGAREENGFHVETTTYRSMTEHVKLPPCRLAVTWDHALRGDTFPEGVVVVDLKPIAGQVWQHRFDEVTLSRLEHILRDPPPWEASPERAGRQVAVLCGIVALLVHAIERPEVLGDCESVCGLGMAAVHADNLELAIECLHLCQGVVRSKHELRLDMMLQRSLRSLDPVARKEIERRAHRDPEVAKSDAKKRRRRHYSPIEAEELLRLKADPGPRQGLSGVFATLKWGLPSRLHPKRRQDVLREMGVTHDMLLAFIDKLSSRGTDGRTLHPTYNKYFVNDRDPTAIPPWYAAGYRLKGRHSGAEELLSPWVLAEHLLQRGRWWGYQVCADQEEVDNELYDLAEEISPQDAIGMAPTVRRDLDAPLTRVLVIDLDKHGDEVTSLDDRYRTVMRRLPGAIVVRSSGSGGLHCWYFLPKDTSMDDLHCRVLDLLGEELMHPGNNGVEIIPRPGCVNNVRIPLGRDSALLNQDLSEMMPGASVGEQLKMLLALADRQRTPLSYLLEATARRHSKKTTPRHAPRSRHNQPPDARRSYPTVGVPPAEALPPPKLIQTDEGTWDNRHAIAGRALAEMWRRRLIRLQGDLATAQAVFDWWLQQGINASQSGRLVTGGGTARNRRMDLVGTLTFLYSDFINDRLGRRRPRQGTSIGSATSNGSPDDTVACEADATVDAEPRRMGPEDEVHLAALAQAFCGFEGTTRLSPGRLGKLTNALRRILRAIYAARRRNAPVVLTRGFLLGDSCPADARLQTANIVRCRPNPMYYKRVLRFLLKVGVLEEHGRRYDGAPKYRTTWPPPS